MIQKLTLRQDMRRRWYAYLFLALIWTLVSIRIFVDPTPRLPILYNATPSLPYTFAYVRYGQKTFNRGDFIIYAFDGGAQKYFPGLRRQPFFKIVRGVPGDVVSVRDRDVFVNGKFVGMAEQYGPKRLVLDPIEPGVIPPGRFFVQGTGRGSFDSRYKLSGLVRSDQILAGVVPLF